MTLPLQLIKLRFHINNFKILYSSIYSYGKRYYSDQNNSTPDALTMFTENLIHSRMEKVMHVESNITANNYDELVKLNLNDNEIELLEAMKKYLTKCINRQDVPVIPADNLLKTLAYYFIKRSDLEGLQLVINVYKLDYKDFVNNGEYKSYLIEFFYNNRQINEVFNILNDYYKINNNLHYTIKLATKNIINSVVQNHSEAMLVHLINHVKEFTNNSKHEYYPIMILWKSLFLSEWCSDEVVAKDIFNQYKYLQMYVSIISTNIVIELLNNKKADKVEKLLEYFLEMKNSNESYEKQCKIILRLLFDYRCYTKNLRACTEIVKTSYELNLPLTQNQHVQFFNVLLKKPIEEKLVSPIHKPVYPLKF